MNKIYWPIVSENILYVFEEYRKACPVNLEKKELINFMFFYFGECHLELGKEDENIYKITVSNSIESDSVYITTKEKYE